MVSTEEAVRAGGDFENRTVTEALAKAKAWLADERARGTLVGEETLWREAYRVYLDVLGAVPEHERPGAWAGIARELVFETGKVPLNERTAAGDACRFLRANPALGLGEKARRLQALADDHNVDPAKIRALLQPGVGFPWMFPRALWSRRTVAQGLEAILAPFEWDEGREPTAEWLTGDGVDSSCAEFLAGLRTRATEGSDLDRMLAAVAAFVDQAEREGRDVGVVETLSFVGGLAANGLSEHETAEWRRPLLGLREAAVLLNSFHLYHRAEGLLLLAQSILDDDPDEAIELSAKAAANYKRLAVAQQYPERLLERQQQIWRSIEELRADRGLADERADQVLLVSTFHSPGDLQRLLVSVTHELMDYAYGRRVRVVVSDDSTGATRERNEQVFGEAARSGLSVSDWSLTDRNAFLDRLNADVFADGTFDVHELAGVRMPGEKGVPYGRLRNFLRLAGLVELQREGLEKPVFTWLDQDNELGALVLTPSGTLAKRHVFNYFDQKSSIFADGKVVVGGGGYTNDALEGVEKFWVAWGILHNALGLAQDHAPQGPAVLSPQADITRFRPWDQSDTLERLPREGEDVETMSDQFLLLLNTLIGTFRGKYDNQVQIYHPWSDGHVADDEQLSEEMRAFAGMPGGNTSFGTQVLASPIPFITVPGRGEDIFHLWQLEGTYGTGTIFLTHSPVLHTRNVNAGRGDLMAEIIDSYNGRIFREPPYIWAALAGLFDGDLAGPGAEVEAETASRIDGLRAEAKASMAAVSGFAAALEPYLDNRSEFWWLAKADDDPRCAELLAELGRVVDEYKDVERHHRVADAKLLRLEDVKELTQRFVAAYPHWNTVVERVGGVRSSGSAEELSGLAGTGPREGYGARLRDEAHAVPRMARERSTVEPPAFVEPVDEPPWQEVLTSSLLLFRRFEQGVAAHEGWLEWPQRVRQLRQAYEHYAAGVGEVPDFVWTTVFRDALFVPHSAPYRAVSQLLASGAPALGAEERRAEAERVAAQFGVDDEVLVPAVDPPTLAVPDPA